MFGLAKDLDLGTGDKYNTALVIFFVPYCLFEVPSNILLKKFKPHVWLSLNMFLFGFTTMMQGLVKNYSGLLATRFFLGLFETGMFPGGKSLVSRSQVLPSTSTANQLKTTAFYLIGMWYKRSEAQRRYSFFFNSTTLAGAFGGLLAAAIGKMNGMRGYSGWRWIFLIEGGLTVLVSFILFFLLPDFPEEAKWLKEDERQFVAARLRVDQGSGSGLGRSMTIKDILNVFKDWKVVAGGFMYFGLIVPAYGYAYFAPTIISTFQYGPIETQLRSVPPWAAAFGFSLLIATLSDRLRHRFAFAVFAMFVAIAGFAILLAEHSNHDVQYGALFLITSGAYTAMPIIVCWFNMNLGNHTRRAVGSAWQVGYGNLGGIIAVFIFLTKDAPKFTTGYSVCLAFTGISMVASVLYGLGCWAANKKRDNMTDVPHLTEEEKTTLGDLSPEYRYLL